MLSDAEHLTAPHSIWFQHRPTEQPPSPTPKCLLGRKTIDRSFLSIAQCYISFPAGNRDPEAQVTAGIGGGLPKWPDYKSNQSGGTSKQLMYNVTLRYQSTLLFLANLVKYWDRLDLQLASLNLFIKRWSSPTNSPASLATVITTFLSRVEPRFIPRSAAPSKGRPLTQHPRKTSWITIRPRHQSLPQSSFLCCTSKNGGGQSTAPATIGLFGILVDHVPSQFRLEPLKQFKVGPIQHRFQRNPRLANVAPHPGLMMRYPQTHLIFRNQKGAWHLVSELSVTNEIRLRLDSTKPGRNREPHLDYCRSWPTWAQQNQNKDIQSLIDKSR